MTPELTEMALAIKQMTKTGRAAWKEGLVPGFSGNFSCRLANGQLLLTAAGIAKGRLQPEDFALLSLEGTQIAGNKKASSESGLHLAIYDTFPECKAILHTHPPYLQALELKLAGNLNQFLQINLHEARYWRNHLEFVSSIPPGDATLGLACAQQMQAKWGKNLPSPCGIWLSEHGLCAVGQNLDQCLGYTEELEHIAMVQLLANT